MNPSAPSDTQPISTTLLELRGVTAGYGRTTVLRNVSLIVPRGKVVALLGPNGAGKTTLLRVASGLIAPTAGEVLVGGAAMTQSGPWIRSRAGLCLIPAGRGVFPNLTVRENLTLHIPAGSPGRGFDRAFETFPVLARRLSQLAGSLSGGEQQMLALARCFLANPTVVLVDEVSTGLAPRVLDQIFAALGSLAAKGMALLLVEQYVIRALALADIVYVLDRGAISTPASPDDLDEERLMNGYLGSTRTDR